MAKFTVFFKDKPVNTALFEQGVIHIGRDDTNDIHLDSLSIAPAHAAVVIGQQNTVIKQLNDNYPLIINNEKLKEANLSNGDQIILGKHSIVFSETETRASNNPIKNNQACKDLDQLNQDIHSEIRMPDAGLQIMEGDHIGRVIPLKKAMTRLGHNGNGVVVITRRKDGYFLSALESNNTLTINQSTLKEDTVKLNTNDIVVIDKTSMRFFID